MITLFFRVGTVESILQFRYVTNALKAAAKMREEDIADSIQVMDEQCNTFYFWFR